MCISDPLFHAAEPMTAPARDPAHSRPRSQWKWTQVKTVGQVRDDPDFGANFHRAAVTVFAPVFNTGTGGGTGHADANLTGLDT